jgi:hypothetical protein
MARDVERVMKYLIALLILSSPAYADTSKVTEMSQALAGAPLGYGADGDCHKIVNRAEALAGKPLGYGEQELAAYKQACEGR